MVFVGIDPGNQGALAIYDAGTGKITLVDTPMLRIGTGKKVTVTMDLQGCVALLRPLCEVAAHVTMEKVNAMPGKGSGGSRVSMGATSAFSFGQGYGIWQGILAALGLRYELVHPVRWKKAMMADMGKEKDASRGRALQLFPQVASDLKRKKDHGRADSLLLAEYGRRTYIQ